MPGGGCQPRAMASAAHGGVLLMLFLGDLLRRQAPARYSPVAATTSKDLTTKARGPSAFSQRTTSFPPYTTSTISGAPAGITTKPDSPPGAAISTGTRRRARSPHFQSVMLLLLLLELSESIILGAGVL